jgi:hypothetical protein
MARPGKPLGLGTFDPVTMDADHLKPVDAPAWLSDTDHNGIVLRVRPAFFPRTGEWENCAGMHNLYPRGNELLVVKSWRR